MVVEDLEVYWSFFGRRGNSCGSANFWRWSLSRLRTETRRLWDTKGSQSNWPRSHTKCFLLLQFCQLHSEVLKAPQMTAQSIIVSRLADPPPMAQLVNVLVVDVSSQLQEPSFIRSVSPIHKSWVGFSPKTNSFSAIELNVTRWPFRWWQYLLALEKVIGISEKKQQDPLNFSHPGPQSWPVRRPGTAEENFIF